MRHHDGPQRHWQMLWDQARNGNADAFEVVYEQYLAPRIVARARQRLSPPDRLTMDDMYEVVQQVGLTLCERYALLELRTIEELRQYVRQMVDNECGMMQRKRKKTGYLITEQTITHLKQAGLRPDLLDMLQSLHQTRPVGREAFLKQLSDVLGKNLTTERSRVILHYSRYDYPRRETLSGAIVRSHLTREETRREAARREIHEILHQHIEAIENEEERFILKARLFEESLYREISESLGKSLKTIHSQCQKHLRTLRQDETLYAYFEEI